MLKFRSLCYFFANSTPISSIMLFASAPVGFPTLKRLHHSFENLSVVTYYSKPNITKRQNDVQKYCKQNKITCLYPVKKGDAADLKKKQWSDFIEQAKALPNPPQLGVICSYGYMIPENVIQMFPRGIILAHPSLIPKYRGGSPIFHAIANGEKQSGVSFMTVSKDKFDHGNLLYQKSIPIGQKDSYEKVQSDLSQLMAEEIVHVIKNIDNLEPGIDQQTIDVSHIPKHQLQARIYKQKNLNFHLPAEQVYNWSRALIIPRVKFNDQQIIVSFDKVFQDDLANEYQPGQVVLKGKHLYMKCQDRLLKLKGWQELTKKALGIHTFIDRFIDKSNYKNQIFFK